MERTKFNTPQLKKVNEFETSGIGYSGMHATITLQYINLVSEIKLVHYDDEELTTKVLDYGKFSTLMEAGVAINWKPILAEFEAYAVQYRAHVKATALQMLERAYAADWMHTAVSEIKTNWQDVSAEVMSKDQYIADKGSRTSITLGYKQYSIKVEGDKKTGKLTFSHSKLTDYKPRTYSSIKNLISKFTEMVDNHIATTAAQRDHKTKLAQGRTDKALAIGKALGITVEAHVSTRSTSYGRNRYAEREECTYRVKHNNTRLFSVDMRTDKDKVVFDIAGLDNLSQKQAIAIIAAL